MVANLVTLFGPLKGSTFLLGEHEVSIGRDKSNSISIVDPLLSRKHCMIRKEEKEFTIVDLNSRNGVFVNGIPTSQRILKHRDEIELGDSVFVFFSMEQQDAPTFSQLDQEFIGTSTKEIRAEDALYLRPDRFTGVRPAAESAVHDLGVLLKISSIINSISDVETLQKTLLQLALEAIPAHRGSILFYTCNDDEVSPGFAIDRASNRIPNMQIIRNIALQAIHQKTGVLCNDVTAHKKPADSEDRRVPAVKSVLCVPMMVFGTPLGILYFDTDDSNRTFDEFHLQLAWGIASIGAVALQNAFEKKQLIEENKRLQADIESSMVGESEAIRKVHELVAKVALTDSTVLICGESGTGKELVARSIHRNSSRAPKAFMAINCASLSENLLESELFGHEKGSFTGAISQKKGRFEIADQGTLFLDEVSEIPLAVQPKLLRVIEDREFQRLGGTRSIKVNIRIIAATNRDLEVAVRLGTFRQDLFYRLNVIRIDVPPLRERNTDIPLLAKYFLSKYSKTLQRRVKGISPEALECLTVYDWPGNVRELENLIERAVVLGSTELILIEDLPDALAERSTKIKPGFIHSVKEEKKKLVSNALHQAGGNFAEAAKILGIHPNYLYSLLRTLGMKKD